MTIEQLGGFALEALFVLIVGHTLAEGIVALIDRLGFCYRPSRERPDGDTRVAISGQLPAPWPEWAPPRRPVGRTYSQAHSDLRERIAAARASAP